ncbi:HET-domain-containing protein, partial [Lizonia empirigonia]
EYATLSHCWGSTMPFKLSCGNFVSCLTDVPLTRLSKVFQDAIKFAWRMDILYIWIDSLCIIQDSSDDWVAESSQMASVYRGGVLNIAATGFSNGQNGLFGCYLLSVNQWQEGVAYSPLGRRGWAVQERALSVRTIHFGARHLFWECACKLATDVWGIGTLPIPNYRRSIGLMSLEMLQWVQIVEIYSKCALTFSKDKLVAISGLAQTLSKGMDCDYLAGLWRQDLEHQLLWCPRQPCSTPTKDDTRGPSWSWVAIDSEVLF